MLGELVIRDKGRSLDGILMRVFFILALKIIILPLQWIYININSLNESLNLPNINFTRYSYLTNKFPSFSKTTEKTIKQISSLHNLLSFCHSPPLNSRPKELKPILLRLPPPNIIRPRPQRLTLIPNYLPHQRLLLLIGLELDPVEERTDAL